jgi:hypothetical protein
MERATAQVDALDDGRVGGSRWPLGRSDTRTSGAREFHAKRAKQNELHI